MGVRWTLFASPVGDLFLVADHDALRRIGFGVPEAPRGCRDDGDPVLAATVEQLAAYFDGALTEFTVPLRLSGTVFERRVWDALRTIPYGETRSYGAIAKVVGEPDAARAVGVANNRNPVPIIVP